MAAARATLLKASAACGLVALATLLARHVEGPVIELRREIVLLVDGADADLVAMLTGFLDQRFGLPVRVMDNFVDLSAASRPQRRQWDHSVLLQDVDLRVHGIGRCVLLTGKDTFGVDRTNWSTGIAFNSGSTAVVSVCRLSPTFWGDAFDRALHERRVRKIVLHELGHSFGQSGHCEDWRCVIHRSDNLAQIDKTGDEYCARCDALVRGAVAAIRGARVSSPAPSASVPVP